MDLIKNFTFDEISVGQSASLTKTLSKRDIEMFAMLSGDMNPIHLDEAYNAELGGDGRLSAHSLLGAALISGVLGTHLPGAGTMYRSQEVQFQRRVQLGDTFQVTVKVVAKEPSDRTVTFECVGVNQRQEPVFTGTARVLAPAVKIQRPLVDLPDVHFHEPGTRYESLVDLAARYPSARTAVVHPVDAVALEGAISAAKAGLIQPILIGPQSKILEAAKAAGIDLADYPIVDVPHSHAAAAKGVELIRSGKADILMKGSLHTDELMAEVVKADTGLRTERRVSHVFVMEVPTYPKLLLITDAAINIAPDLLGKRDIVQSAIELAHTIGTDTPKVAILSAVETVTPKLQATMDAAALCKMADRGQIVGGLLDGPLAFDNAISKQAAKTKGIRSEVAGDADILLMPDLEAGNMVAKQLQYLAEAESAGLVLGARVPIVLTSRADGALTRKVSCALAVLHANRKRNV
jgi:phosphate acetyltransferase